MQERLGGRARELLEARNFCHVATIARDCTPYVVVAWVDVDEQHVLLNTAEGRAWAANLRRDPRVTLTVLNGEDPAEYVRIRGHVVAETHDGADEHLKRLTMKYTGEETLPSRHDGEVRVVFRIHPERVTRIAS